MGYRRLKGGGKNQLIAKAVGIKQGKRSLSILDATAGLGTDAFILASLGCTVHMVERSPVIAALLLEGMQRGMDAGGEVAIILGSMSLTVADAKDVISQIKANEAPDVIYLDPMFPHSKKSALPKVEMRLIRDIVGDDLDADLLLSLSLQKAKNRVVVKRAKLAPVLSGTEPSFVVKGRSNRYDIYLTKR